MINKTTIRIIAGILVLIVIFIVVSNFIRRLKFLKPSEVTDYQGEKLSTINDFRENSIHGPQKIDTTTYKLKITGLVSNPMSFNYHDVIKYNQNYKKVVKLDCVEGWGVNILWEGVLVKDLINKAKPLSQTKIVIFKAYDGYSTSFPIDYIMKNDIMIAYKMNNVTIPPERGFPFELVAESKWGYKWIKWITEIELSADESYKGYWESCGYSNEGDLNKPFLEK
jgi:DMSO/TMAO reductase YedYZ molybdopterin-dependent catalytic subunit